MTTQFAGETAVVTGAARGIGKAIADRFGTEGASLALLDVRTEELDATATALRDRGIAVEAIECDVSDLTAVENAIATTVDRFGGLDVLVNNAGIGSQAPVHELDPDEWQRVIDVNLTGQFYGIRAAAPAMIDGGGGRIVNISSMAGRSISYHGAANYTASKWGVIGLTKHAAVDLADHDIRVNAVCPGATMTELVKSGSTEEGREATRQGIPLGRWSEPEDQADAVAYLAGDDASFVTGTVLEVDGGGSLSHR